MRHLDSLLDLAPSVDFFLIDMWGVLWDGTALYDGVLDMLTRLKQTGKGVAILSNSTQLGYLASETYRARGLVTGEHVDDFITSGDLCFEQVRNGLFQKLTATEAYRFAVVGTPNPSLFGAIADREVSDVQNADVLYISGCPSSCSLNDFVPQLQTALDKKIPAVCANPDYTCIIGGRECPANGALAKWYEDHGGVVHWIGKPYPEIYRYALERTGFDPSKTVMVGDTPRTDIAGGQVAGIQTVLITGTGVTAKALDNNQALETVLAGVQPDYILDTFAAYPKGENHV